jgi:glycerol-3-phosphate dehydrogenase
VALVEQRDYASGTSSRSSKLFHGGLRYLEQFNFGLVHEALAERNLMLRSLCPHLARPVSFIYPLRHRVWERIYVGAGVFLYDVMAKRANSPLPRHEHLSRKDLATVAPALNIEKAHGAIRYWDAQVDDARHTMMLARTAAAHGAALGTSTKVMALVSAGDRGQVVEVLDLETGRTLEIACRAVINATGVWSDGIQKLAGGEGLSVNASKGVHLVIPRSRIDSTTGMIVRTPESVLFVIPFDEHWIVGTTDTPWTLRKPHPAASQKDIDYLLKWVNSVVTDPLRRDDVVGVYAGLRPLLTGESDKTSKLSREHAVVDNGKGLISVAGGKYTTYRLMASDAVDATATYFDQPLSPSRTASVPLVGADGYEALRIGPSPPGIDSGDFHRLLGRYGSLVSNIADLVRDTPELGERLVEDAPYLKAELVYAATHEGALHLDDFLTRRTRISIETRHRGTRALDEITKLIAPLLGWDEETSAREIEHYRARIEAERDSQRQPDDHTADAARMGAPDVRTGPTPSL